MAILAEYHRPKTVTDALDLLADRTAQRLPLAGGTQLVGALETRQRRDVDGVVDLAALELSYICQNESSLRVGAMTTLTELVEHPQCADLAAGILPATARFEGPQNLRNAATVGGLVALAEPDSEPFAALLALNALIVAVDKNGAESHRLLEDFTLANPRSSRGPMLITEIQLPLVHAKAGHARIARSPMDRCIVAAVAVAAANGDLSRSGTSGGGNRADTTRTALCGVGSRPQIAGGPLLPTSDYRGSGEYRLAMAEVVGRRARADAAGSRP